MAVGGAGPGGASAIFLFVGIASGLIGAALHSTLIAFLKGSLKQKIIIPLVFSLLGTFIYLQINSGILNGYQFIQGRSDYVHLYKDDEIIVMPTIVSLDVVNPYIVGLRLEVQDLECGQGGWYSIRVLNNRQYFVLNTHSGELSHYFALKNFEGKLEKLNISQEVELDYSAFDNIWNRYSKYYEHQNFETCIVQS